MTSDPCILLVYLGGSIPKYALANIRYLRRTFPAADVWLAHDTDAVAEKAARAGARTWRFDAGGELRARTEQVVGLDPEFRSGFWINTMMRLWAVAAFAESNATRPIVHIEADVWLSPTLDLARLSSLDAGIGYPLVNASDGAASVLLVREWAALSEVLHLVDAAQPGATMSDMGLLGAARDEERTVILPSAPDVESCFHPGVDASLRSQMSAALAQVGGIIDAATWGQYLLGLDARNARGRRRLFVDLPHHAIDCRNATFSLDAEGGLDVHGDFGSVPVLALHVHSKDIRMFTNHRRLLGRRVREASSGPRTEFDAAAFASAIGEAVRRRMRGIRRRIGR